MLNGMDMPALEKACSESKPLALLLDPQVTVARTLGAERLLRTHAPWLETERLATNS